MKVTTHYEIEELFGDGKYRTMYQSKVEADYETPQPLRFDTKEQASSRIRRADSKYYRIVEVTTTRVVL